MDDEISKLFGGLIGNALGSSQIIGLFQSQAQMSQAANPYANQLQLQGLQNAFTPVYPWHNPFEIGSDQWERKEWDRRFAESMNWDKTEFYIQLGGIQP